MGVPVKENEEIKKDRRVRKRDRGRRKEDREGEIVKERREII